MINIFKKINFNKEIKTSNFLIFLIFFALFYLTIITFYFQGPFFISPDDSWYHMQSMLDYKNGIISTKPVFHPFTEQSFYSHYHLYHKIGGYFLSNQPSINFYINIIEYKIYQAFFNSFLFSLIGCIVVSIWKNINYKKILKILLFYFFVFSMILSLDHGVRFLIERPHIVLYIFSVLGMLAYLKNKKIIMVVLGALTSLFYSVSLMFVFPLISYFFVDLFIRIYEKQKLPILNIINNINNILWAIAGVLFGTILHPEPYYQFWVGNILHFKQIYTDFFGITAQMTEFADILSVSRSPINVLILILMIAFVVIIMLQKKHKKDPDDHISKNLAINLVLFIILSFIINRFIEYAIIFSLFIFAFGLKEIYEISKINTDQKQLFSKNQERVFFFIIGGLCFWLFFVIIPNKILYITQQQKFAPIEMSLGIKNLNLKKDSLIYNGLDFSLFPILTYFNNDLRFAVGYSSIFEYEYDKDFYKKILYYRIKTNSACRFKNCKKDIEESNLSDALKNKKVDYLFLYLRYNQDTELFNYIKENQMEGFSIKFQDKNFAILEVK